MNVPYDMDTLMEAQKEVIRANHLESGYIRPIIWVGSEMLGVSAKKNTIHTAIAAWPWGAYLGDDGINKGIRVKVSSYNRHHVNVSLVRAKASGYYINSILANRSHCRRLRTKPCYSTRKALFPKVPVKMCSSSKTGNSILRIWQAASTVSLAIRLSLWPTISALKSFRNALRATMSIVPTKPSFWHRSRNHPDT